MKESRKTAQLEYEDKYKAEMFRPNRNNKFYNNVISKNKSQMMNYTTKDPKLMEQPIKSKMLSSIYHKSDLLSEISNLNVMVSRIKEFQSKCNPLKFVDREFYEMKD